MLAILFAYLISPLVNLVRRPFNGRRFQKLMPAPVAILISYLILFAALGLGISNLAPIVSEQGSEFAANVPAFATSIRQSFRDLNRRFDRLRIPEDVQTKMNDQAMAFGESLTAGFGALLLTLASYLPWLVLVPILAFFFLKDANLVRLTVLRIFPVGHWRLGRRP